MAYFWRFKMSLVQKLILSFALSGACLMAALFYSISGLGTMHKIEQDIAGKDLKAATTIIRLRELVVAQERLSGHFMILKQPEYSLIHQRNSDELCSELFKLRKINKSQTVADLEATYSGYIVQSKRLFAGEAPDMYDMKKTVDNLIRLIDVISENQRLDLSQKLARSDLQEEKTVAYSLGLAFAGVVLSFLIAAWMVYSFASSIGKLQHATHRIAAGDFDYHPDIEPGDEIGILAEDFRLMAAKLKELEQISLDASPLTRLPGNIAIERVINRHLREKTTFAMCYLDLDNFKSYNDRYGYIKASEVLKNTGEVIYNAVKRLDDPNAFVGHIGGDDFVVIISADKAEAACKAIIKGIDALVPAHYSDEDRCIGAIEGIDRYGVPRTFPLISISIAALLCRPGDYAQAAEIATAAAKVKDHVKVSAGSNYVIVEKGDDQ